MLFGRKKADRGMQEEVTKIPSGGKQAGFKKKSGDAQEKHMGDFGTMDMLKPKTETAAQGTSEGPREQAGRRRLRKEITEREEGQDRRAESPEEFPGHDPV